MSVYPPPTMALCLVSSLSRQIHFYGLMGPWSILSDFGHTCFFIYVQGTLTMHLSPTVLAFLFSDET